MTKKEALKLIADMDPNDGLRVKEVTSGNEQSLHLGFYHAGRPVLPPWFVGEDKVTEEIWAKINLTDRDYGDKQRHKCLAEAICRFYNTGGTRDELQVMLNAVDRVTGQAGETAAPFQISITGFHLINTFVNTEGYYEHLFATDDGSSPVIRWVEGQFLDVISLQTLQREIRQTEEDEAYVDPFFAPGRNRPEADQRKTLHDQSGAGPASPDAGSGDPGQVP